MKTLFCLFLSLFYCSALLSAVPVAEVIKMRGTATKLVPGALEASKVELNDKLTEDTSILTGPKSFLKIRFIDKSEVSVGPESKIVISQMPSEQPGIIALLKGRIRAEVEKETKPKNENKFFVRTRTAALGIRGTDFQTIYNPDNRMTSLLTFKGSVAMARVDETTHKRLENQQALESKTVVERDAVTQNPEVKQIPEKKLSEQEELKKVLSQSQTVVVPPGQNAFASTALKKSSLPVKISPVQLNALYKNTDFEEKSVVNLKSANTQEPVKLEVSQAPQQAPAEGLYNAQTGDFAPKAGGFIDLNTGLYVAPGADAVLDSDKGIYKSSSTGDVDVETGDYFAPKGLVLDAKKGFVLAENTETKPELLALREDLNKSIARDVVVGDPEGELKLALKNINEKFIRDRLTFIISNGEEKLKINEDHTSLPHYDYQADDAMRFSLLWNMASLNRFSPYFGLSFQHVDYSHLNSAFISQDSKALFTMLGGVKYALTREINLKGQFNLNQNHFFAPASSTTFILKRIVTSRLALGAEGEFFERKNFSLFTEAQFSVGLRKRFADIIVSSGKGLFFKLMPQYAFSEKRKLGIGIFTSVDELRVTNQYGGNDQKRRNSGLELNYSIDL